MILHLESQLLRREKFGNLRQLQLPKKLIDFSSNDYLGLARSSYLATQVIKEWKALQNPLNGLGSTGSRLLTGNGNYIQDLENQIAKFHGFQAGLLFNCGYMANVGLLSIISSSDDCIIFDSAVHASTHQGIHLAKAKAFPFRHNNLEHLEARLKRSSHLDNRFILVESIYSTNGSKAPLKEICVLAKRYEAYVIVDEAHAVGACGPLGKGLVADAHLTSEVFAQVTTFGKALGTQGAIVLGNHALKHALINFSIPYIYTTALPFLSLAAIKCSYDLFPKFEKERNHLKKLIQIFNGKFQKASQTHIQAIPVKGNEHAKQVAKELNIKGFDVRPLLSPTVQKGHEVLRICLHAFNTEQEVKDLLEVCTYA